jgi:hypothetical protein
VKLRMLIPSKPFTIFFRITLIYVDPMQLRAREPTSTHIANKYQNVLPCRIKRNSPPAITIKTTSRCILTTMLHHVPAGIQPTS